MRGERARIVLVDTITSVDANDAGAIVVAASHGGTSSGTFALEQPLAAVFFNDAGVGKDDAGIAALAMLQARGVAAGAVSHRSCRIGDVDDMWKHGSTDAEIFAVIRDGAKGTGMRGFAGRMTTKELWTVLNYVRTLGPEKGRT